MFYYLNIKPNSYSYSEILIRFENLYLNISYFFPQSLFSLFRYHFSIINWNNTLSIKKIFKKVCGLANQTWFGPNNFQLTLVTNTHAPVHRMKYWAWPIILGLFPLVGYSNTLTYWIHIFLTKYVPLWQKFYSNKYFFWEIFSRTLLSTYTCAKILTARQIFVQKI